jgi:hypothetical protein
MSHSGAPESEAARAAGPTPAYWLPYALLAIGTATLLFRILYLNGGKLVYTLDDPYIHLAVAENIARGTYGVNLGESSAPSSSILYPFLFLPFTRFVILEWMPLAINVAAAAATLFLWSRIVGSALDGPGVARSDVLKAVLVSLLIPATNLVGVIFTGMEHSLQLFATAALVAGLTVERDRDTAPWWLWAAIVLGPLIRYENLALSLPALAYLFVRGRRRTSLGVLGMLGVLVGGFSLFLYTSGHGLLPTSVMLKTGAMGTASGGGIAGSFVGNLFLRQGALLALLGGLFATLALGGRDRNDRQLAAWAAVAVALHMLVGRFDWFSRYELYIWTAALLTGIILFQAALRRLAAATRLLPLAAGAATLSFVIGFPYIYTTLKTPLGSNNIFEQHYQMHRFATEYYDGAIAVTDLGWASFRNDHYVLDLWGLAMRRAAEARLSGDESYMDDLAREYDIGLAMLYGAWYPNLPERWKAVAEMRLGKRMLTPAADAVTFYVLDPAVEPRIRDQLRAFGRTLPQGVDLRILP